MRAMGMKANEVTQFAKQVMRECVRLQKNSGMTIKEFAKACGFGEDYWYKRQNFTRPLNLSDLERISEVTGVSVGDIVMDSQRHAIEDAERKAQAGGYGLAAYDGPGQAGGHQWRGGAGLRRACLTCRSTGA